MGGVTDHQGLLRTHTELVHELQEHLRMRLGMAFIGAARAMEITPQATASQHALQPHAALAGGHRQHAFGTGQLIHQRLDAGKQAQLLILRQIVMAVACRDLGIAAGVQLGHGLLQGVLQAQADDMTGAGLGRWRQTQIGRGLLDGMHDGGRRIHQRTVPVKDDEFKTTSHVPCFPGDPVAPQKPPILPAKRLARPAAQVTVRPLRPRQAHLTHAPRAMPPCCRPRPADA